MEEKKKKLKIENERKFQLDEKKRAVTEMRTNLESIKGTAHIKILEKNAEIADKVR